MAIGDSGNSQAATPPMIRVVVLAQHTTQVGGPTVSMEGKRRFDFPVRSFCSKNHEW